MRKPKKHYAKQIPLPNIPQAKLGRPASGGKNAWYWVQTKTAADIAMLAFKHKISAGEIIDSVIAEFVAERRRAGDM